MTEDQLIERVAARVFTLARAKADATDGVGQIEGIDGEAPPCSHGALPGFSSGVVPDDELFTVRRRDGAISLVSLTHVSGEQAGDRTIWTSDGLTVRLRGKVLEVTGSEALDGILLDGSVYIVRHGDSVTPTAAEILWKSQAALIINAIVGGAVNPVAVDPIGTSVASTTKVKAG